MPIRLLLPILFVFSLAAAEKVDALYARHCAACHGERGTGGLGGSLVDGTWRYVDEQRSVETIIVEGLPEVGMQPLGEVLSDEQVRGLAVYVRELQQRANRPPRSRGDEIATDHHRLGIETVVDSGLEIPWGLCELPDGGLLVSERPGRLRQVTAGGELVEQPVRGLPPIVHHGQGGLMEVAVHPAYAENGWIYISYADASRGGRETMTVVQRGRIRDGAWVDGQDIFRPPARSYSRAGVHFGCRLVFHDGYLFFGIGDRGAKERAQDPAWPNGSIFRLHDDGRVPGDNPFTDRDGATVATWSIGHRNPQGLAIDRASRRLYSTEHGPRGGDELNLIEPGANYGWPLVTHGINYNGTPITAETGRPGLAQPLHHWTPSIAVCGLAVYRGAAFDAWRGDLLIGSLKAEQLQRIRLDDAGQVSEQEVVLNGLGRIRSVVEARDGSVLVVTNGPDRIIRLRPR